MSRPVAVALPCCAVRKRRRGTLSTESPESRSCRATRQLVTGLPLPLVVLLLLLLLPLREKQSSPDWNTHTHTQVELLLIYTTKQYSYRHVSME